MRVCLPKDETDAGPRADGLASKRSTYTYAWDWPAGVATAATLPKEDDYSLKYVLQSAKVYVEIGANLGAMALDGVESGEVESGLAKRFEGLDGHTLHQHLLTAPHDLAAHIPGEKWAETWREFDRFFALWQAPALLAAYQGDAEGGDSAKLDLAFAWQRVAGVNPMVLARCDRIPAHFAVDAARYARVMQGDTLEAALAEHRAYVADYAALEGIATGTTDGLTKYLAAPLALFAVDKRTLQLRPVAVQCGQTPGPSAPVVSPGEGWRWRMAMTLVQIADANAHEGIAHLGRTHMVMEAVKLAVERQLAVCHPLYALLTPHVETTLAINHSAKTSLIAPNGTVDRCFAPKIEAFCDVVRKSLETYPLDQASPRSDLAARGLDDATALPSHPYREDAIGVWDVLDGFVGEYLALYYTSDADVEGDTELAAFATELGANVGGRLRGVVVPKTIVQLRALITQLIFIAGPQHSAVNFAQYPSMGYVPNTTGASFRPTLADGAPDDEKAYTAMFPPWKIATEGVTMIYLLSHLRDSTFGDYGLLHFADLRVHAVVASFQQKLKDLESRIEARDAGRLYSYPYLRPSQILQSISI